MKKYLILSLILVINISCKSEQQKENPSNSNLSTVQKIANAHGFEQWNNVNTFKFTFGGNAEDPNSGRSWNWNPKTNDVILTRDGESKTYNRNSMDSIAIKSDRAFINDKFWALIPFQLVWDEGTTISEPISAESPVSKKVYSKITIAYSNEGGYTPGDAYDIYYDNNYMIREWTFRRGDVPEPTMSNTFENYIDIGGIKVAQEHKRSEGNRNLLIRNVNVEFED